MTMLETIFLNHEMVALIIIAISALVFGLYAFQNSRRLFLTLFCGTLFAIPLITIVHQGVGVLNDQIQFTQKEIDGVKYHSSLMKFLLSLQELRGTSLMVRNGDTAATGHIKTLKKEIIKSMAAIDDINDSFGKILHVSELWQDIRGNTSVLLEKSHSGTPMEEFEAYTRVIDSILELMNEVGNASNMILDPQKDSYFLADSMIVVAPKLITVLGKMRGLTSGFLASSPSEQWTDDKIEILNVHYYKLEIFNEAMLDRLEDARKSNEKTGANVSFYENIIGLKLKEFKQNFKNIVEKKSTDISASDFFWLATGCIDSYDDLYGMIADGFIDLLKERQRKYAFKKGLIIYPSILAFLGFIGLFIFLYRNLIRTENAQREAMNARIKSEREARIIALLRGIAAAANTANTVEEAIRDTLMLVCKFMNWPVGHAYILDHKRQILKPSGIWFLKEGEGFENLREITGITLLNFGEGLPGRVWKTRASIWISDLSQDVNFPRGQLVCDLGVKSGFAFPVKVEGQVLYVLSFFLQILRRRIKSCWILQKIFVINSHK